MVDPAIKPDDHLREFAEQFVKAQETPVAATTRIVKLIYKSCCGCGCSKEKIRREVPFDSDLTDGKVVHEMLKGDIPGWKK